MQRMFRMWSRRPVMIAAAGTALALMATGTAVALTAPVPAQVASVAVAGRSQAALKIVTGPADLDVTVARLAGALLRVSTPDDAPVRPVLTGSEPIVLSLQGRASSGGGAAYTVSVVLSSSVRWSLDFAGGTQRTQADLRGGQIDGIAVTAGSDALQLSLPRPAGTLPVLLAGGVSDVQLSLPDGVPARITAGGGGGYVSDGSQDLTGVAGGTVLTPPGWAGAVSRVDLDATAGFSRLTVTRYAAPPGPR